MLLTVTFVESESQRFRKTFSHRGRPTQSLDAVCPPLVAGLLSRRPRAVDVLASQTRLEATPRLPAESPFHFTFPPPSSTRTATGTPKHRRAISTHNRAPLPDSSLTQHHRELLHVRDPTATPFSPQVALTVSAAPPGRHDHRRPSSHMAVLLVPLAVPSLPCVSCCVGC